MKEYAARFYKSKRWKDTRATYLASVHGLCENCLSKGMYVPATMVHHVTMITEQNITNPEITLSWDNLQALCVDCHAEMHHDITGRKRKQRRYKYISESGTVII